MEGFKHFYHPRLGQAATATLHGVGVREWMRPGVVNRPAGTGDWLLMFFYQPCLVGGSDGIARRGPHSLVLWAPGQHQHYGHHEGRWVHSWSHFGGRKVGDWVRRARIPTNVVLPHADAATLERDLLALDEEAASHAGADPRIVANLLENLLLHIARQRVQGGPPPRLLEVKRHIDSQFERPLALAPLAKMAHLSVAHFCAEFKRWFGSPAIDYAIGLRMRRAAYLLHDRNLRIKQIAARVGYDDPYHFSKLFRKHFDVSPRQYRQQQMRSGR